MVGNQDDGPVFGQCFNAPERDACPQDAEAFDDQEIQDIDRFFMCAISPRTPADHLNGMEYGKQKSENKQVDGRQQIPE
jgi:hypothetical protein